MTETLFNAVATVPLLLAEWDFEKNQLDPYTVSKRSKLKVWWKCKEGHSWSALISSRTSRAAISGCRTCFYDTRRETSLDNNLAMTHPALLAEWHPKNRLSPRQVTYKTKTKVWWQCKQGHEWRLEVRGRTMRSGDCPNCSSIAALYPELMKEWDFEKNTRDPQLVLPGSSLQEWWKCSEGHSWKAKVNRRTLPGVKGFRNSCPVCKPNHRTPRTEFVVGGRTITRISRDRTITHIVANRVRAGVTDYIRLLTEVATGIKSGEIKKPASCIVLHNIIKNALMEWYKPQGYKNWRAVYAMLKVKPPTLLEVQEATGIKTGYTIADASDYVKRKRGRPKSTTLKPPKIKQKRTISPENKAKLHAGLKAYHAAGVGK